MKFPFLSLLTQVIIIIRIVAHYVLVSYNGSMEMIRSKPGPGPKPGPDHLRQVQSQVQVRSKSGPNQVHFNTGPKFYYYFFLERKKKILDFLVNLIYFLNLFIFITYEDYLTYETELYIIFLESLDNFTFLVEVLTEPSSIIGSISSFLIISSN